MTDFKASRFNTAVSAPAAVGGVLLFNTATRALLHVSSDVFETVRGMFLSGVRGLPVDYVGSVAPDIDPELSHLLHSSGFIVPADLDELALLRNAYEEARENRQLFFTIGLTMACNFDCPYCFEEHRPEHMDHATADAVHSFVVQRAERVSAEGIFVNWFGGEPLLNLEVLEYLSSKLAASSSRLGASYNGYVITNGALLTPDSAKRLVAAGVSRVQVTVDGPAHVHNRRRPFKGGKPSFDRILGNLVDVRDIISVIVRVNVDTDNRPFVPELVAQLKSAGVFSGAKTCTMYVSPVVPYTEQSRLLWQPVMKNDVSSLNSDLSEDMDTLGLGDKHQTTFSLLRGGRGGCSAMDNHSFVIGPLGHLFKCELGIHDIRESIGLVPGSTQVSKAPKRLPVLGGAGSKALDWGGYNPFSNHMCSTCQFVPICKSGCPKKVMENAESFMKGTCEYWDTNFANLIHQAYGDASKLET